MSNDIFVFILAFIIHELGHYAYGLYKDIRPKFIAHKYYFWVAVTGAVGGFTFIEHIMFLMSGIILGAIPVIIYGDIFIGVLYILISSADIINIIGLLTYISKFGNRKMVDLPFLV